MAVMDVREHSRLFHTLASELFAANGIAYPTGDEERRREIALAELRLEYARIMESESSHRSDLGWLTSIVASAGGTMLAVHYDCEASSWFEQARVVMRLELDASDLGDVSKSAAVPNNSLAGEHLLATDLEHALIVT